MKTLPGGLNKKAQVTHEEMAKDAQSCKLIHGFWRSDDDGGK